MTGLPFETDRPSALSRRLGPSYWYGGPWAATVMTTITKTR
jgi:hypothetical protein